MKLQDKVAIITGAGRGIGQATAVKFATEGAKVVVCDLSLERIKETVEMCKETRGDAMGYVADVRDIESLEGMVAATVAKWGRVDCLVNNAGIVAASTGRQAPGRRGQPCGCCHAGFCWPALPRHFR